MVSKSQELLNTLEELLVREFRLCQVLYNVTKEERTALSGSDVQLLLTLVERKEALLDELSQLDDSKRMVVQEIGSSLGLAAQSGHSPTLAEVLAGLDPEQADCLSRLRTGILALTAQLRDLTHGNRALASSALERADALQAFLLSLYHPPSTCYRPQGAPTPNEPSLAWEVDHLA